MELPSESNTLAASAIFLGSIVIDAVTATDPIQENNAPTALRTSAVILISILASPPIRQWMLFEQRLSVAVPLAGVALLGWHEQSVGARVCDAVFIVVTLGVALLAYWLGGQQGISARKQKSVSKDAPPYLRREQIMNLAIAQLLYSSMRTMRMAFRHPHAARDYVVASTTYNGALQTNTGYAYASAASTSSLAFGSAAGIGIAAVLLVNREVREHGTSAGTLVLTTGALAQFFGAFVATMAISEQMANLTGIFSAGACNAESVCKAAFLGRRFALVNSVPASLWLNALGTLLLAFAPSIRIKSREDMQQQSRNFELTVYAVLANIACLMTLFVYLSFTGAEALIDYAAVAATLAVVLTAFFDSLIGSAVFLIAVGSEMLVLWANHGAVHLFSHFTHCTNATMLVLLAIYVVITATTDFFWQWMPRRLVDLMDSAAGILVVSGTSLSVLLFLASASLQASYDGVLIADSQFRAPDRRYERTAAAFIMEHFLPVLIWLPLYSCRCDAEQIRSAWRSVVWYSTALVPTTIWLLVTATSEPTWLPSWYADAGFVLSLGVAGIVPWLVVVWA